MTVEDALILVDAALEQKGLTDVQALVVRQVWQGSSYARIAEESGYNTSHIRDVGFELWRSLSQALGEKVSKSNLQSVLRRRSQQIMALTLPPLMV